MRYRFVWMSVSMLLSFVLACGFLKQERMEDKTSRLMLGSLLAQSSEVPRILIIGDSILAGSLGRSLEQVFRRDYGYEVLRQGKVSSGLARPDFYNWEREAQRLVAKFQPHATVVMFGSNDPQGLYMGQNQWIAWRQSGWRQEYTRRINTLCDILAPEGQPVVWIGVPVMRSPTFRARVQHINAIYHNTFSNRSNALFIDIWHALADNQGRYAETLYVTTNANGQGQPHRQKIRVRAKDGIHLTSAGAGILKNYVFNILYTGVTQVSSANTIRLGSP